MAAPAKLGRGLSALMGDGSMPMIARPAISTAHPSVPAASVHSAAVSSANTMLAIDTLSPGKYQPRRHFDQEALAELADSIEKHGLMQPIVVRAIGEGRYEIIAGERRWRAAKLAVMREVPVIIRTVNDAEALELALIENIQRADLNPLEEAAGYQRLMEEFGYTQEKLAPVVGKSRSHIANLLRLLKLPDSIKNRIDSGELTMGHARAILLSKDPEALARTIVEVGLSVRQAEDLAKGVIALQPDGTVSEPPAIAIAKALEKLPSLGRRVGNTRPKTEKNDDVLQLEAMLAESLGLRVSIDTRGTQTGEVIIGYDSLTQLDEILRRLGGNV